MDGDSMLELSYKGALLGGMLIGNEAMEECAVRTLSRRLYVL